MSQMALTISLDRCQATIRRPSSRRLSFSKRDRDGNPHGCPLQVLSSASLSGFPTNWISWPAPSITIRDEPIRPARSSQMASNPALWPPDTTSFGNAAAASFASGGSDSQIGRPRRNTGTSGTAAAISSGGKRPDRSLLPSKNRPPSPRPEDPDPRGDGPRLPVSGPLGFSGPA